MGQNPPQLTEPRPLYIIANKNKGLLIKENVVLDLFAMVFEENNLKKSSMLWKNERNFSIIWPKKDQCHWHNILLLLAQSIKVYQQLAIRG